MTSHLSQIYSVAWRAALTLLTLKVATDSLLKYFTALLPPPPPIVANAFADPFLAIHVVGGVIALVVGPLQFISAIRARWPKLHRGTGRLYVLACIIGAPSGLVLAVGTTTGPVAAGGFAMLALLWAVFTLLGVRAAIDGRFSDHREWMIRSYAMTAAAITLRLMLPAADFLGIGFAAAYPVIAWLCWSTNLAIAEFHVRCTRHGTDAFGQLATT